MLVLALLDAVAVAAVDDVVRILFALGGREVDQVHRELITRLCRSLRGELAPPALVVRFDVGI